MARARLPKILCVDDEPGLLRSMRWLMRGRYEVAVAGCGMDALALLGGDSFDVVISGLRMPGMNGTELLEHARLVSPRTVRLLLTGTSDLDAVLGSLDDAELFRFLSKPWDSQKLLDAVAQAVSIANAKPCTRVSPIPVVRSAEARPAEDMVLVFNHDDSVTGQWRAAVQGTVGILGTGDIAEALSHLSRRNVAVLIADLDSECTEPLDLIRAVNRHLPFVAVLVCGQACRGGVIDTLISEGLIHSFIAQPATLDQMNRALHSAMARRRAPTKAAESAAPSAWLLGLLS